MALAPGLDVAVRAHAGSFELDVAFTTGAGTTAILGESGAGKTLTLRAIAGLLRPDSGHVTVRGRTVFDSLTRTNVPVRERELGYVFQDYALFPHLTVARNLSFGLRGAPRDETERAVARAAGLLGIDDLLDRMPDQLSGGQRQRVAVGRALATGPSVLLLDEPFSALDAPIRANLTEEFATLQHALGIPALLVTHDVEEAYALSDRMVVLSRGRVLQADTREEVFWSPSSPEVARLVGVQNVIPGVVTSVEDGHAQIDALGLALRAPALGAVNGAPVHAGVRASDLRAGPAGLDEPANATLVRTIDRGTALTAVLALRNGTEVHASLDRSTSGADGAAGGAWRVEATRPVLVWPAP